MASAEVLHFGWQPPDPTPLADAVAAAQAADFAVVFAAEPSTGGMDHRLIVEPGTYALRLGTSWRHLPLETWIALRGR